MNLFVTNLLLALAWGAMTGSFTLENLVLGFILGFVVLFGARRIIGSSTYFGRVGRVIRFVGFYLRELVLANARVAADIVTPAMRARPALVAVPLDAQTDLEITILANLLTMTPGSLSVDISQDRKVLYVHGMFVDDPDSFRREIKDKFERRVLELLR